MLVSRRARCQARSCSAWLARQWSQAWISSALAWPEPSRTSQRAASRATRRSIGASSPGGFRGQQDALLVALRDVALHGAYRYLQAPGDVRIWQAFQLGQQERLAHFRGQAVQKGIDLVQGFQDQGALFGRGACAGGRLARASR